jgi:hypothetical protein
MYLLAASDYTGNAMPPCRGSIRAVLLYDVAEEIDLKQVRTLLGTPPPLRAPDFRQPAPNYVRFEQPPVLEATASPDTTLRYFDYGVVSLQIESHFECEWSELVALSHRWIEVGEVESRGLEIARRHVDQIQSALRKPYPAWIDEAYYIIHLHPTGEDILTQHGADLAMILRGETQPLSEAEQKEVLSSHLSYFPSDLLLVGWLGAVICDTPQGAAPIVDLLEYANTQLLEYRRYDEILTDVLKKTYGELERRSTWRMSREAKRMNRLRLEVIELTERTDNAIKFLSDMFYARAYKLAAAKVGANDYRNLVDQKLKIAGELYHFMVNEFREARAFLLELTIVIILIIELLPILKVK